MLSSYPIDYMLVQATLAVVSLYAQFGATIPDESRSPMAIRPSLQDTCRLGLRGEAWVGKVTVKGGSIEIRDQNGAGILAVSGSLRYHFANGRYDDQVFRHQSVGFPSQAIRLTPQEAQFGSGLMSPTKIEGRILGVYFGNGEVCGETGQALKSKHDHSVESVRKDAAEATGVAEALPRGGFEDALKNGLLKDGPYARASTANSNAMLRANLIGKDGKLVGEYKQWLKRWQDSLRPAKLAHQKR